MQLNEQSSQAASGNLPDVAASSGGNSGSGNAPFSFTGDVMSPALVRDWIETKNKKAALKLEKLDTDLKNYKSNSIKVISEKSPKLAFMFRDRPSKAVMILGLSELLR